MKIKYLPTGNVFDLPVEECKRIYEESPFNYEILDGAFKKEAQAPKSTVAQKVLEDEEEQEKTLNDLTVPELKALCDENGIKYAKSAKKADLIALLEEPKAEQEDGEDEEEQEEDEEETEDGETDGSDENEETEEESEE